MIAAHHNTKLQQAFRILMGLLMVIAGAGHLTFARETFQVQVPDWVPMDKDAVVLLSGVVEIFLGFAMVFIKKYRIQMGIFMAVFYILVFPGNLSQYLNGRDGFGLNTDLLRFIRLLFQPVLIFWALCSTGVLDYFKAKK